MAPPSPTQWLSGRLVVPGWTGTYWTKHLAPIEAATKPFGGFWMNRAYRIPNGKFPIVDHFLTQMAAADAPITEMVMNSLITATAKDHGVGGRGRSRRLAWDGGYGIRGAEISTDGGDIWQKRRARRKNLGRFSFRAVPLSS